MVEGEVKKTDLIAIRFKDLLSYLLDIEVRFERFLFGAISTANVIPTTLIRHQLAVWLNDDRVKVFYSIDLKGEIRITISMFVLALDFHASFRRHSHCIRRQLNLFCLLRPS